MKHGLRLLLAQITTIQRAGLIVPFAPVFTGLNHVLLSAQAAALIVERLFSLVMKDQ